MLKSIFSILTVASLFATSFAQETEGHVSYTVEFSSKNPEMQMSLGMLQGSKMDIHFTDGKSRTEMKVGTLMSTTTIIDVKKSEMLILMSGMMGNNAIQQPVEKNTEDKPKNVELLNETKEIAGFTCKKGVITDDEGNKYTFWYTDKIKAAREGQKYFDGNGIPGFPMQMEISQNGMEIKMTGISFEKLPKKHKLFEMSIPDGYKVMTKEEFEKMSGGM